MALWHLNTPKNRVNFKKEKKIPNFKCPTEYAKKLLRLDADTFEEFGEHIQNLWLQNNK